MISKTECVSYGEPEEVSVAEAKMKALAAIRKMAGDPSSCFVYEESIANDSTLDAIGWEGTRALMLALNELHTVHDNPSLHRGSTLFSQSPEADTHQ